MISALLTHFRNRYPMGALTSELLTLHNDSYVVRAQVQVDGIILATGLAAAPSIEAAEDKARIRALQTLMLEQAVRVNSALPNNISESIAAQATTAAIEPSAPAPISKSDTDKIPAFNEAVEQSTAHQKPEPREASLPSSGLFTKPKPPQPPPPDLPQSPVDLSDIIAQTDVELRRLGWTSAQGREYLEQTYGKRSRQQLSDEELLTFLLYLESLPSPIETQI